MDKAARAWQTLRLSRHGKGLPEVRWDAAEARRQQQHMKEIRES